MPRKGENIRKRKDGRWEGRYIIKDGNISKMHSVYASSYTEVKQKLNNAKADKQDVLSENETKITLNAAAEGWLEQIYKAKKRATYEKYRTIYQKYIKNTAGTQYLININYSTVEKIYQPATSESSRKSIQCVLKQILEYAQMQYHISLTGLPKLKCPAEPSVVRVLNTSEQAKLVMYLYQDMDIYKFGILLCLHTGLRLGEICSLKWEDIDFVTKSIHIKRTVQRLPEEKGTKKTSLVESSPKTCCSEREIPVSTQIYKLLLKFRSPENIYFLNQNRPFEPRTYQYKFKHYLYKAGVADHGFHILRHTFATNCISCGADVKSVSEILGHSDVKITLNRYVHPSIDVKRNHLNQLDSIYGQYKGQTSDQSHENE